MKLSGKPWIMNEGRSSRPNPQRMLQASGPQHPDCSFYRGLLQAPAVVGRGDFVPCRGCNMEAVIEWLVDVSSDFTAGVLVFIIFPFSWVTLLGRALRLLPDWDVLYNMERCPGLDPRDTSIPRKDSRASAPSVTIVMLGRGGCQGRPADSPEVGPW